jgi:hypothetical protein
VVGCLERFPATSYYQTPLQTTNLLAAGKANISLAIAQEDIGHVNQIKPLVEIKAVL